MSIGVSGVRCSRSGSGSVAGILHNCLKSRAPKLVGCSVGSPPRNILLRGLGLSLDGVGALLGSLKHGRRGGVLVQGVSLHGKGERNSS